MYSHAHKHTHTQRARDPPAISLPSSPRRLLFFVFLFLGILSTDCHTRNSDGSHSVARVIDHSHQRRLGQPARFVVKLVVRARVNLSRVGVALASLNLHDDDGGCNEDGDCGNDAHGDDGVAHVVVVVVRLRCGGGGDGAGRRCCDSCRLHVARRVNVGHGHARQRARRRSRGGRVDLSVGKLRSVDDR
jgi:hypothetical protein